MLYLQSKRSKIYECPEIKKKKSYICFANIANAQVRPLEKSQTMSTIESKFSTIGVSVTSLKNNFFVIN